MEEEKPVHRPQ